MPIFIREPELEARLQTLAEGQPIPTSKAEMVRAVLGVVAEACERTGNPEAWREIGNAASASVAGAQPKSSGHLGSDDDQTIPQTSHRANGNGSRSTERPAHGSDSASPK